MIGYGYSYFVSTILDTESGTAPVNTVAPVISGGTSLGSVLSSTTGTWTGTPTITYAYQWKRNGSNISSATNSTYTITLFDAGANITCVVTATNLVGSNSATSNIITVQIFSAPVNTVAPAITGTAKEGQTLTCSTGTWTGNPTPTYAYQWKRNNVNIGSATNSTYLLVSADVGQSIKCTVTATNAIGSVNADSNSVTPIAAVDPDAQAFITAASITNPTQQSAINQLVVDLKGYNIWTKMKALYPFVGGTAAQHKWNLKDPRDLDAAFRLVFNGGWTHSSTGATPNGTNGYADTKLLPQTQISQNSAHISAYSRTNSVNSNDCLLGTYGGGTSSAIRIVFEGGTTYRTETNNLFSGADFSNSVHNGFFVNSRISSTGYKTFRSGATLTTKTISSLIPSHKNIFLSATNGEFGTSQYSLRQLAFASIGDGLTDTEAANFYTAVQAFQTTLGRQV